MAALFLQFQPLSCILHNLLGLPQNCLIHLLKQKYPSSRKLTDLPSVCVQKNLEISYLRRHLVINSKTINFHLEQLTKIGVNFKSLSKRQNNRQFFLMVT
jgi:hypothetical protein